MVFPPNYVADSGKMFVCPNVPELLSWQEFLSAAESQRNPVEPSGMEEDVGQADTSPDLLITAGRLCPFS